MVSFGLPAAALIALGAASTSLLGVGVAGAAPATTPAKPATFQMYANVDREFDLGSNYDAVGVKQLTDETAYIVTFKKPIGHCAAVVQPGKAGGSDPVDFVSTTVVPYSANAFLVEFGVNTGDGGYSLDYEPFMITVTCKS